MTDIIIAANKVWSYFEENQESMTENMHLIAENEDYGVEIYVTQDNEECLPEIVVMSDSVQQYSVVVASPDECEEVVLEMYEDYLTDNFINKVINEDFEREYTTSEEIEIENRNADLEWGVKNMLEVVFEQSNMEGSPELDEICEDCMEHMLEYIARKYDVDIYRPMYIEYDDGIEYEEYPYDKLIFDDEDNPIYTR